MLRLDSLVLMALAPYSRPLRSRCSLAALDGPLAFPLPVTCMPSAVQLHA